MLILYLNEFLYVKKKKSFYLSCVKSYITYHHIYKCQVSVKVMLLSAKCLKKHSTIKTATD